jgi:hypothetical protein
MMTTSKRQLLRDARGPSVQLSKEERQLLRDARGHLGDALKAKDDATFAGALLCATAAITRVALSSTPRRRR